MDENEESAPNVNILMVDDHPENLLALEVLLAQPGQTLVKAQSGKEALRHLLSQNFAVIILDVQMAEMDGFETAAILRERETSRYTPIIFLTGAHTDPSHVFKGYAVGAVDYLIKPVVPEILQSKVAAFVELARKTELLEASHKKVLEAQSDLRETEAKFRTLVEQLPAVVYLMEIGETDSTVYISPQIETILGFKPDEWTSSRDFWMKQMHPDDLRRLEKELLRHRRRGMRMVLEYRLTGADGRERWIHDESVAIRDEQARPIYRQGFMLDITDRKVAEAERFVFQQELARARDDLEIRVRERTAELMKANQELETLLHVISHDLKEPVRAIKNFTVLFKDRYMAGSDEKGRDFIHRIVRAGDRMGRLINEILTLSKVRQLELPSTEIDGGTVVREALERLEDKIKTAGAKIQTAKSLPVFKVDKVWAVEALYNLIDNALKFTRPGIPPDIEIGSYLVNGSAPSGLVVRDRGPGVPAEQSERIFQLFQRAVGRDIEGTGAGLAIVRQIAERHGGAAWVEPRDGGGSEFIVTFGASGTLPEHGRSPGRREPAPICMPVGGQPS